MTVIIGDDLLKYNLNLIHAVGKVTFFYFRELKIHL